MDWSPHFFMKGQGVVNAFCKNKQNQTKQIDKCDGHNRINMEVEAASSTNPKKGLTDKRKINIYSAQRCVDQR